MPVNIKEARTKGQPVYIPGGDIKGWEYGGDFVPNPDFVAPEPPKVEQLKHTCSDCRKEMPTKGRPVMRNMNVLYVCDNCIKKYGQV